MGCSVLNSLYQLDISLVEICFIYTFKLRTGGLVMSAHNPWLQFVIELFNSPNTEVKRVVLVKDRWYEIPSSSGLPFNLNQSLTFPSLALSMFLYIFHFPRWWVY